MKEENKPVIMIDLGGVYFTSSRPFVNKFTKKLGMPAKRIIKAMWDGKNWTDYATGKCDDKTYWTKVSNELKISRKQMHELRKACYASASPQDGMIDIVRNLKRNYKVVVLSSHVKGWIDILGRKYKLSKEFHGQHYSFDHSVDKPSASLFKKAARKMKTKPENCIVVNDNKTFLAAVKKAGAKTILFKNVKQLELQLKKLGVKI
ncbi:HAD-IA family hydrolase [archaeon]|nr:HAD-IA family hydrolase [archaeon]